MNSAEILLILPELTLTIGGLILLMVAAFAGDPQGARFEIGAGDAEGLGQRFGEGAGGVDGFETISVSPIQGAYWFVGRVLTGGIHSAAARALTISGSGPRVAVAWSIDGIGQRGQALTGFSVHASPA